MATEIKNDKGFKVLEMNSKEFFSTGGFSICDNCNKPMEIGFYIAVLNMSYCEADYKNWLLNAINYPEDRDFENGTFLRMNNFLESQKI